MKCLENICHILVPIIVVIVNYYYLYSPWCWNDHSIPGRWCYNPQDGGFIVLVMVVL